MPLPSRRALARLARKHRLALLLHTGWHRRGFDRWRFKFHLSYLGAEPRSPPDPLRLRGDAYDNFGTEALGMLDLGQDDPLYSYEAFLGGRLLYEKSPGLWAGRYSYAARRYADTRKFREGLDDYLDAVLARWRREDAPVARKRRSSTRRRRA